MKAVTLPTVVSMFLWLACLEAPAAEGSLYLRLGGEAGVSAISTALIERIAHDPATRQSFKDAKLDRIERLLAEQICELSGGPCRYSGDSMREVHAGHHISQAEFYRTVDTLREILKERHVDLRSTNELLRLLAPMKRDVVEARAPSATNVSAIAAANVKAAEAPPPAPEAPR